MRKIYAFLVLMLVANVGWGQTTVFSDDFSTNTSGAYTTGGVITSTSWFVNRSGADWGARRSPSPFQLELTNDVGVIANVNGWISTTVDMSGFSAPYTTTLNSNTGDVTWSFNMRQIRTDPAGFAAGSYGVAFILAGTSTTNNSTGNGYAIALGQAGATDPIRLIRYTNGFTGTLTNIITSNTAGLTDFGAEYLSIKVVYTPSTNTWELFLRNDGATAFADPLVGTLTSQGTAVDNTYTGTSLTMMGGWWQGSTAATQTAFFDNTIVTVGTAATPDILLSSLNPAVTAGNISQGSTNNVIYRFDLAVTTANATLTGVTVTTAGTYVAADLTNLKCWYSADATFNSGTDLTLSTKSIALGAGTHVFPSFSSQNISSGATGYIFVTADVTCAAVIGNTISVNAITTADITFSSGNKSGLAFAGDVQTVVAGTPNNVTAPAATNGNTVSSVSWTNPTGCYDAVLIVAAAGSTNIGIPVGDGTAYTGVLAFGAGTSLGNGFVVYNSITPASPQVVTALTNGTTYFFKIFTRLGTTWSSGVEVSATPQAPTVYTWIGGNSTWTTDVNWSPTRTTPDVADILQFNDGGTWTVTAVPTQTIGNLVITGNTTVNLQAGAAANTLTIGDGTGTDLSVTSGSALNIDGANVLNITFSTGATGAIAGNMTFSIANHRMDAADASAITFSSPSVFTQGTGCGGNVFNNTGTTDIIIFATGSTFVQNAGSNPFGFAAPASKVTFQAGSLYRYQVAAAIPSLSNRTYADFELANGGTTLISSGTSTWTADEIRVSNGTFNITANLPISIRGGLQVDAAQTFNYSPALSTTMTFNGTSAQAVINNGTLTFGPNANVTISNTSANVVLNTNAQFNNLTITASANLDLNAQTLSVTGFMTNGGALTTNLGTVDFSGASGTQTLTSGGTGVGKTFYNLTHSGAGTLELATNSLRVMNNFTNNAGPFNRNLLNLTVGGNFSCTGTYATSTGTLTFDGSAIQNWSGNVANNYGDVTINKSSGNAVLLSAITVDNLTLTAGKAELGTNNLTITNAASGGSATSYIMTNGTGTATVNNINVPAKSFPIGNSTYNPLIIANGSGHNWTARVTDAVTGVIAPFTNGGAVQRTWTITPSTNPPSLGADLTFQWDGTDPSQLGPLYNNANNVQLWHYQSAWLAATASLPQSGPANARTLTRTGWTQFSDFAIANVEHPLPVLFASFSGYRDGSRNQLRWTTATEVNNRGFEVLRSADGTNYSPIGFVNSLALGGSSPDAISYGFTDHAPAGEKQYYRLRQVDLAGAARLSEVVLIRGGKPNIVSIEGLFPNPAKNLVNVIVAAPKKETITLLVTDMSGRNLLQKTVAVETGSNTLPIDISALQSGSYLVRVICSEGCEGSARFVK